MENITLDDLLLIINNRGLNMTWCDHDNWPVERALDYGEFYQFNLSSCIRQQNSLTAQFVSFSLSNLANIFYPPPIFTIINLCLL